MGAAARGDAGVPSTQAGADLDEDPALDEDARVGDERVAHAVEDPAAGDDDVAALNRPGRLRARSREEQDGENDRKKQALGRIMRQPGRRALRFVKAFR